jgi:hypothetical protein
MSRGRVSNVREGQARTPGRASTVAMQFNRTGRLTGLVEGAES